MRVFSPRIACVAAILAISSSRALAGPVYTFDNPSQSSPFAETENGLTATFGSPVGVTGFSISPAAFKAPFSGNALFNNPTSSNAVVPLTASFSKGVFGVSMDFGTIDPPGRASTVTLMAFSGGLNGTLIGTVTATGKRTVIDPPPGQPSPAFEMVLLPQGIISFSSTSAFDTIELSSGPGVTFAIDNLSVVVPEPATFTLAGLSLFGAGLSRWRRRGVRA